MRWRHCGLAALLAWAALVLAPTASSATFADIAGDSSAAPDVTSVAVSNTVPGTITFRITVANQPSLSADSSIQLLLDTDRNPNTGREGFEYGVLFTNTTYGVYSWNGTQFVIVPASSSKAQYLNGVQTFSINKGDLAGTTGFDFRAVSAQTTANVVASRDFAPDAGNWTYRLTGPIELRAGRVEGASARTAAGRSYTVAFLVTRTDTGKRLSTAQVTCRVKVAGKRLKTRARLRRGAASCSFFAPNRLRGKRLTGSIEVRFSSARITRSFFLRVA